MAESVRNFSTISNSDSLSRSVHELHKTVGLMNERNQNQALVRFLYSKILTGSKELDKLIESNRQLSKWEYSLFLNLYMFYIQFMILKYI